MSAFSSLRSDQKEAIGLLQVGTFLEYFDLMLYVHMAVLLNELFFPKTDPHTVALLSAFAFCSTFVLRPFGALLFGYLGDYIGRKSTVVMTTMLMAISCIAMANLPTYAQIGITAAWMVTICRIIQGISSLGEIVGAEVYLMETIKAPLQYPCVALVTVSSVLGTVMALVVASAFTSWGLSWRIAFWIGSCVAVIGSVARTRLRETPEFADMKRRLKKAGEEVEGQESGTPPLSQTLQSFTVEKGDKKKPFMFFLLQCAWPICFYFSYIHCGNVLKQSFSFTAEQIIHQNLIVSIVQLLSLSFTAYLSYWVHPLKILKVRLILFSVCVLFCPYWLQHSTTSFSILLLQFTSVAFAPDTAPAVPIFLSHFPIFRRFTYASFTYALSRASMYVVTSFGLIYFTDWFGHWGLWLAFIPAITAFGIGIRYFENLERYRHNLKEAVQY